MEEEGEGEGEEEEEGEEKERGEIVVDRGRIWGYTFSIGRFCEGKMLMFVDIKEFKWALEVENMLAPFKRGKAEITPEVCQEVLEATNYPRNIRDMLECILKLPAEKQAGFKGAVLNTFDNREQPNEVLVLGKKLAVLGGYEAEFGAAAKMKDGEFLKSGVGVDKWVATSREGFTRRDLSAYQKLILLGGDAYFSCVNGFPAELDVCRCSKASFWMSNFSGVENLKFGDGAKVNFTNVKNLPKGLDVSMCSEVVLHRCDLARVENLQFAAGAEVDLACTINIPADLDVSMCSRADFRCCNLAGLKLGFADGAAVDLSSTKNLPKDLDVSMCSKAKLNKCDLRGVKKLKFKNRQQMKASRAAIPENWGGKLAFAEEENNTSAFISKIKTLFGGR